MAIQALIEPAPEAAAPAARGRRQPVSKKRQARAQCCLSELTKLQDEYPEFFKHIGNAVDALVYQRDRTRESDREAVLQVLEDWDETGIVIEDLVDETGYLSRWDVGEILKEIAHLVVEDDEYRPRGSSDKPRKILRFTRAVMQARRAGRSWPRVVAMFSDRAVKP